ncbi:hypothetical protein C8Q73DRAFT_54172 [Cubamyces lactineus]|nr:hypothetical protein C8Q73DRAFT_54172 [Cubamyces lactineus]
MKARCDDTADAAPKPTTLQSRRATSSRGSRPEGCVTPDASNEVPKHGCFTSRGWRSWKRECESATEIDEDARVGEKSQIGAKDR